MILGATTGHNPAVQYRPSVLLVAAHPDDEYYCAATLYRIARELGGLVDQVIVTDGAGGHRFAGLAGHVYGLDLREGGRDHALLPEVRREESRRAGKLLGLRQTDFLGEPDPGFTLEEADAYRAWKVHKVEHHIEQKLMSVAYDAVFVLSPQPAEHGHHKAVASITKRVVSLMEPSQRPCLFAVQPAHSARPTVEAPVFEFHRSRPVERAESLTYSVIVNWLIAEYKSQGLFQLESGRHDCERFWALEPTQAGQGRRFFERVA